MRKPLFYLSLEELAASSPSPVLLWGCSHSPAENRDENGAPTKGGGTADSLAHKIYRQSHIQTLPSSKQEQTDKGSDPREMPLPVTLIHETGG